MFVVFCASEQLRLKPAGTTTIIIIIIYDMLSNQSQYVLAHRCLGGVKDQLVWSILPYVDFSNHIYDLATEKNC